jgi:hypothetical protein
VNAEFACQMATHWQANSLLKSLWKQYAGICFLLCAE